MIFATSEAMRFKINVEDFIDNENLNEDYLNEINDLKSIKNILSHVQELIRQFLFKIK